jgi:condensin complex subunit 2
LRNFKFSGDNILDFAYASTETEGDNYPDFFDNDNYNDNEDVNVNVNDILGDNLDLSNDVSEVFDEENINPHARLTEKDYVMAMVSNENELFSYFDSAFLRNWAGPEHWKLKKVIKSN